MNKKILVAFAAQLAVLMASNDFMPGLRRGFLTNGLEASQAAPVQPTSDSTSVPQWSATFKTNVGPVTRTFEGRTQMFNMNLGSLSSSAGSSINGFKFTSPLVLNPNMTQTEYMKALLNANLAIYDVVKLNKPLTPEEQAQKNWILWLGSMDKANRDTELAKYGTESINYINWLAGMSAKDRLNELGYDVTFNI